MFERKKLTTYPIKLRQNKIKIADFAQIPSAQDSATDFLAKLPKILAGNDFQDVVEHLVAAWEKKQPIILAMGAHVIKCGLNPLLIDMIKKGLIAGLALNGAGAIHDFEISYIGETSEDVAVEIKEGRFGMVEETGRMMNEALIAGAKNGWGFGESIGRKILANPYQEYSLLAACVKHRVPVTVHVALGNDIIHMHPACDGAAVGQTSYQDFLIFVENLTTMEKGGVYLNIGSAVVLPEVFLKAVSMVRNAGFALDKMVTVNMDMQRQYRPLENVVKRPTNKGGKGYMLVGQHEINVPLLVSCLYSRLGWE